MLCLLVVPALQAMEMPKVITMDDAKGKTENPVYTPVDMPHQQHLASGIKCEDCHHKWEDRSEPPKRCIDSGCHDVLGAEGKEMNKVEAAYNAHHNQKSEHSCIGCHQSRKKAGKKAGPVPCQKCHEK